MGGGGLCALAVGDPSSVGPWAPPHRPGPHSWSGMWYGPHPEAPSPTRCLWPLDPTTPCPELPGFASSSTLGPGSCASACESAGPGAAGEWPTWAWGPLLTLLTCCVTCGQCLTLSGHCSGVARTPVVCTCYSKILPCLLYMGRFPYLSSFIPQPLGEVIPLTGEAEVEVTWKQWDQAHEPRPACSRIFALNHKYRL